MKSIILFLGLVGLVHADTAQPAECIYSEIQTQLPEDIHELSGVWYKVAHKESPSTDKNAFTLKLEPDGAGKLKMTEYYQKENECKGPVSGVWESHETGNIKLSISVKQGETWEMSVKGVYHGKNGRVENEEVIALYGCKEVAGDGQCASENQVAAILSKNPEPSARLLHKAYKALQKKSCVSFASMASLDTDTECGNELIPGDNSESSSSESSEEEEESSEVDKCSMARIKADSKEYILKLTNGIKASTMYMIAARGGLVDRLGLQGLALKYKNEEANGKYLIHSNIYQKGECYGFDFLLAKPTADTEEIHLGPSLTDGRPDHYLGLKGYPIEVGNRIVSLFACDDATEGKCASPNVGVLVKGRKYVSDAEWRMALRKLEERCVDPSELSYMSSDVECSDPKSPSEMPSPGNPTPKKCKVKQIRPARGFKLSKLEGVWYTVASDTYSKLGEMNSIVTKRERDGDKLKTTTYFENEGDECVSGNTGTVVADEAKAEVTFNITWRVNGDLKNATQKMTLLYAGPHMLLAYYCKEKNTDGTCKKSYHFVQSRTRDVHHADIKTIAMLMKKACINMEKLDWKDLHSNCGSEVDVAFKQRHGYLAMTHSDVMNVITKFSSRQCNVSQLVGQDVDLEKYAKAGTWYGVAYMDSKWNTIPFYGFIAKYKYEGADVAIGRELCSMDVGEGKKCYSVRGVMVKMPNPKNPSSKQLRCSWSIDGEEYVEHMTIIWTNYKLSLAYGCREQKSDGSCKSGKETVVMMSTNEAVDHSEYLLMEHIVQSLCVDPNDLTEMNSHEPCFHRNLMSHGKQQYAEKKNCNWDNFVGLSYDTAQVTGTYHTVAIAEPRNTGMLSRTFKMERLGEDKLKVLSKVNRGGQCVTEELEMLKTNDESNALTYTYSVGGQELQISVWLAHVVGQYRVLIGCVGADCDESTGFAVIESQNRALDKVALHDVYQWLSDHCIHPDKFRFLDTHNSCGAEMDPISCEVSKIVGMEEFDDANFNGIWYLVADRSGRYKSMKCKIEDGEDENQRKTTCYAIVGGHHPTCIGPSEATVDYKEDKKVFEYNWREHSIPLKLLYLNDGHMVFYLCHNQNDDGSCMRDRTTLMYFAKESKIDEDEVPEDVETALRKACVHKSILSFLEESECGADLE